MKLKKSKKRRSTFPGFPRHCAIEKKKNSNSSIAEHFFLCYTVELYIHIIIHTECMDTTHASLSSKQSTPHLSTIRSSQPSITAPEICLSSFLVYLLLELPPKDWASSFTQLWIRFRGLAAATPNFDLPPSIKTSAASADP